MTDAALQHPGESTESSSPGPAFRGSPVVGYVRSTARGGADLESLVEQVRNYADNHGLWLADVVRDEGTSAVAAWRPRLEQLIRDLEQCRYAGVVVPDLDHFGKPRSAGLRVLHRIEATSAWVAFIDAR
ncbi:recombinase family protein [Catellatospora sichuanensis]|uniref:recombinase family protein n=1 Tax=Catellatospora sichuanensis TaxID=1969805 RepID=UPI0016432C57|nr:recombinase family protein [Catellatospora sichuanensis]